MANPKWENAFEKQDDRRRKKRMAVLRAGAWLFNQRGFERTTLDDIADALKVTKRTLYYYVSSKEEILVQCNIRAVEKIKEIVEDVFEAEGEALDLIEKLLWKYIYFLEDDMGVCLILSVKTQIPEADAAKLREGRRMIDHALRTLIKQGIADGSIAPCNPKLTAAAIFGAFNWVPYWNTGNNAIPLAEIASNNIKFILKGLRAE